MKNLAEFTKLSASDRMDETKKMLSILQQEEELLFDINENPKPLQGFKMPTPDIMLGTNTFAKTMKGSINLK